jgi:multidrug efflux system membrane fusion protein
MMRIVSILVAMLVAGTLYLFVMERDALLQIAGRAPGAGEQPVAPAGVAAPTELDDEEVRRVAVVAYASVAQPVDTSVILRGRTEAARQVEVRAETTGRVISEPLRRGAEVTAGQVLCEIDPGTREATLAETRARLTEARARLPESRARVAEAEARLAEARINDRAARSLSQSGFAAETRVAATAAAVSSAEAQLETARTGLESAQSGVQAAAAAVAAAETEIDRLTMEAPFEGVLEDDSAELGLLMQPGQVCATVLQLDPIELIGFAPEAEIDRVALGAAASARLVSGGRLNGEVTYVSRSADPETRTFRVDVEVPNRDLSIREGQTVEISIATEGALAHLLPASALTLDDAGRLGVRTAEIGESGDVAIFVPVQLIRDTREGVLVSGLPETARVIVVGQEFVTDGVALDVTMRDAPPTGAGTDPAAARPDEVTQ